MTQDTLVDRTVRRNALASLRRRARRMRGLVLDDETAMDLYHLGTGAYTPLEGFLGRQDYESVIERQRLADGTPWTIPITLAVASRPRGATGPGHELALRDLAGRLLGAIRVRDVFRQPKRWAAEALFGTTSLRHPGVARLRRRGEWLLGGAIELARRPARLDGNWALTPRQVRAAFARRGWRTIAAFHTRNLPHRAHEYLQRCALELVDGLLIHPIVGPKKAGDFQTAALLAGYAYFLRRFLPPARVMLAAFSRPMEFAGPREAVFHAIVRRNFGCTHMIIGRDHAGMNHRYPTYAAHAIFDTVGDLGIEPLRMRGPFYCRACGGVATDKTCAHGRTRRVAINGTDVRRYIAAGKPPPTELFRPELAAFLLRYRSRQPLFHA